MRGKDRIGQRGNAKVLMSFEEPRDGDAKLRNDKQSKKESPVRCVIPNRAKERISTTRYCVPADIISHQQGKGKG